MNKIYIMAQIRDIPAELKDALRERAIQQGKAELAADILHDVGNAIVGLGSHLTRIRRNLEGNKAELLLNLATFLSSQQAALSSAIGEEKAKAVVNMVQSLSVSVKEMCEEIRSSANGQLAIMAHVQEILNIQRQYVAGREPGEYQPVNLRAVVTDGLSMLSATMDKRNIHLASQLPEDSALIMGDRTRLMQVVMNLLKNSIEATDRNAGEKQIDVQLCRDGEKLVLRIADNGCGFDAATGARLLERGFTTKSSGTGLGLYNCWEIVKGHAGTVAIASDGPGKGAAVTIQFKIQTP